MSVKVSIIIPVYNTEDYLRVCLESVLNQTLQEIEIIVVNDGSTDNSLEILKEYEMKHPEKLKVLHKENGGLSSARNYGLQYATGEFLAFVDSDDWIETDMCEEMYNKAKEEQSDIVICDMVDHYPERVVYHHSSVFDNKFHVTASACNKMFRTEFIGDIRFPIGLWYEDLDFTTRQLMKTNKISVIHKGFYCCHCREVSIMNNNNAEKNKDILTVLERLDEFVNENGWQDKYASDMEYLYINHILITTINRLERQKNIEKRRVINYLRTEVRKKYPQIFKGDVFKTLPRNRKIIAYLNAIGLSVASKMILEMKSKF